jgi:hypothetical protein
MKREWKISLLPPLREGRCDSLTRKRFSLIIFSSALHFREQSANVKYYKGEKEHTTRKEGKKRGWRRREGEEKGVKAGENESVKGSKKVETREGIVNNKKIHANCEICINQVRIWLKN